MLNYRMELGVNKFDEHQEFVARFPALDVIGVGDSYEEAIKDLTANAEVLIEVLKEDGTNVPVEDGNFDDVDYSGKMTFRMSKRTHRIAAETAEKEGVSLNQFLNDAVNYYLGERKSISDIELLLTNYTHQSLKKMSDMADNFATTISNVNLNYKREKILPFNENQIKLPNTSSIRQKFN